MVPLRYLTGSGEIVKRKWIIGALLVLFVFPIKISWNKPCIEPACTEYSDYWKYEHNALLLSISYARNTKGYSSFDGSIRLYPYPAPAIQINMIENNDGPPVFLSAHIFGNREVVVDGFREGYYPSAGIHLALLKINSQIFISYICQDEVVEYATCTVFRWPPYND